MHLTDEQLNEYLDHEANDREQMELHLAACEACAARLAALGNLFAEIESLSEVELSPEFSVSFAPSPKPSLPLSLTLTFLLQAALTVLVIMIAAPFVRQLLPWNPTGISIPSLMDIVLQLQSQWTTWLKAFSTFPIPALPELPGFDVSSLVVMFTVVGVSLLWLIGNGLLLRNQIK
jgi:hypothetical protein